MPFPTSDYKGPGADVVNDTLRVTLKPLIEKVGSLYSNVGEKAEDVVKGAEGVIISLSVFNESVTKYYLWLFDSNQGGLGCPAKMILPLFANAEVKRGTSELGLNGLYLSSGISYGISTSKTQYLPLNSTQITDLTITFHYL